MKKTLIASVACLSLFCFAEKSEAASLAEILGIIGNEIDVDGIDVGGISLFSNNNNNINSGNGGGEAPAAQQPTTTNNYNAPIYNNNYFGPVVNNFFSGPTFNFTPDSGTGGNIFPPIFGGGGNGGLPIFNPIIFIGPVNINITFNITIFNGPVSIARSGGF